MKRFSGGSPTREGLLQTRRDSPQRRFHDEVHRSSGDSERVLDEIELQKDGGEQSILGQWAQRWFGRYHASARGYDDYKATGRGRLPRKGRKRSCPSRYKICFITSSVLLGLFLILSGSGALWVYKTVPEDGVSPVQVILKAILNPRPAIPSLVSVPLRWYCQVLGGKLQESCGYGSNDDAG